MLTLFPHQTRTIQLAREAYQKGATRICLVLPTGAGKTITACSLVEGAIRKGRRILWLTHRRELVDQAARSLARLRVDHGVILAGRATNPTRPIQVASVQTIANREAELPPADIIIPDETHHVVADTWRQILSAYPRAEGVFGLTATPERGDRSPLGDVFQAMVVGATIQELTGDGSQRALDQGKTLVPCYVKGPGAYQKDLCQPPIEWLLKEGRRSDGSLRPTVLFAGSIADAQRYVDEARRRGIRAAAVDGGTSTQQREDDLDRFATGRIDLIANVMVLTEGWDAPRAEVCLLARGCSNAGTLLQMIGRVLRASPKTGKQSALLLDGRGVTHVHDLPNAERVFSLHGRAISSSAPPRLRQCAACGAVFQPQTRCPLCGLELAPLPRQQGVRLAEVMRLDRSTVASTKEKKTHFESLCKTAMERRYAPKWVGVQFKQRWGHWPGWALPKPSPVEAR